MEHEEHTTYPCCGKKYNGEKAIISLTSWKERIDTCSKTIFSLLKMCPGFHIVLVLSEEEFPQREKELPEYLTTLLENNLIELLWIYKNYKSYKKWIFTSDKYKNVPIISADDDCIYHFNFAEELYVEWKKTPTNVIRYPGPKNTPWDHSVSGPWTIYPPFVFFGVFVINGIKQLSKKDINDSKDDDFYCKMIKLYNIAHRGLKTIYSYNNLITFFAQESAMSLNNK